MLKGDASFQCECGHGNERNGKASDSLLVHLFIHKQSREKSKNYVITKLQLQCQSIHTKNTQLPPLNVVIVRKQPYKTNPTDTNLKCSTEMLRPLRTFTQSTQATSLTNQLYRYTRDTQSTKPNKNPVTQNYFKL